MSDEILKKVKLAIVSALGIKADHIELGSRFVEDFGADSLDLVELVMTLEEEFELEIPDAAAMDLHTVQNVVDYLKSTLPTSSTTTAA